MFVFSPTPTPKESQVGFEIMSLNLPMEGKEDSGAAGFKERFMKEEVGKNIRYWQTGQLRGRWTHLWI